MKLVPLTKKEIENAIEKAVTPTIALKNLYMTVIGEREWILAKKISEFPAVSQRTDDYIIEKLSEKFGRQNIVFLIINQGFSVKDYVPDWTADISNVKIEWKYDKEDEQDAYLYGYEEGKDMADYINHSEQEWTQDDIDDAIADAVFPEYLLPEFRRLAGCEDDGYGTYQDCGEDAHWRIEELGDIYEEGYMDGFQENMRRKIIE